MRRANAAAVYQIIKNDLPKLRGGTISFEMGGMVIPVDNLDIMGGMLQCWIREYLRDRHGVKLFPNPHTQEFPDFFMEEGGVGMLELKCFDSTKNPNFDLANFDKYLRSLLSPGNDDISADFLVLGYAADRGRISIREVYLKKIWQMTGPSPTNVLNLQVKQGKPVNIRPKDFRTNSGIFHSEEEFLKALDGANAMFNKAPRGAWLAQYLKSRSRMGYR
jgi:type II restriction enzyme